MWEFGAMPKNAGFWRGAPSAHTCKRVFGYLGWGCLKYAMPENVGFWPGALCLRCGAFQGKSGAKVREDLLRSTENTHPAYGIALPM